MMYENMLKTEKKLEKNIKILEKQIEKLPEGKMFCAKNGDNYKWYRSDGHIQEYIYKKDRKLAEKLAMKKYLLMQIDDLREELSAIKAYLKKYKPSQELKAFMEQPSEYKNLLATHLKPEKEDLLAWMQEEYVRNTNYPEALIHKSMSGNRLRSKSEAMIDSCLYRYKVPYRYEDELQLGEVLLHPDFTIRHPVTGKYYYWEHFGLMDDPGYSNNTAHKIELYISHGYIPMINLITTFETKENPLGMDVIEKVVQHFFVE